jgi:hypothetical protein
MVSKVFVFRNFQETPLSPNQVQRGYFQESEEPGIFKVYRLPNILTNGNYIFLATKTPDFKKPRMDPVLTLSL